jgi:predicted DNA-binding transcriptional regulator AlpA
MSPELSPGRGQRIIRPREAWERLGIGHSKFYADFVNTGRLRLLTLGPQTKGVLEHELDALIDQLAAARDGEAA